MIRASYPGTSKGSPGPLPHTPWPTKTIARGPVHPPSQSRPLKDKRLQHLKRSLDTAQLWIRPWDMKAISPVCLCGCGQPVKAPSSRFVDRGHYRHLWRNVAKVLSGRALAEELIPAYSVLYVNYVNWDFGRPGRVRRVDVPPIGDDQFLAWEVLARDKAHRAKVRRGERAVKAALGDVPIRIAGWGIRRIIRGQ